MAKNKQSTAATRRKFLGGAAVAGCGDHRHAAGLARTDRDPEDAERLGRPTTFSTNTAGTMPPRSTRWAAAV